MSGGYAYHPKIPGNCPLDGASPVGSIYRAVAAFPPKAEDFLSDIEARKSGAKATNCKHWGCSVWETVEAATHAREIYDHFRKSYIVVGELDPSDGQVLSTPSNKQPQHVTFWKVHQLDVSSKFKLAFEPDLPQQDDPLGPA